VLTSWIKALNIITTEAGALLLHIILGFFFRMRGLHPPADEAGFPASVSCRSASPCFCTLVR